MGEDIYSYSKINLFNSCPKRYKFYYLDRIIKNDEGIEAFLGKVVHQVLEWIYDLKIKENKSYYSLDSILEKYKDLWSDSWHSDIRWLKYSLLKQKSQYWMLGMNLLTQYYHKYGPDFDQSTIKTEEKIEFNIKEYPFIGIVDRIDEIDSKLLITDYKTGKKKLSEKSLKDDLQMGIYHLAIKNHFKNSEDIELSHYYLRTGNTVSMRFQSKDETQLENNIIENIHRINLATEQGDFESRESNLCNWCYYWKECDKKNSLNPAKYF